MWEIKTTDMFDAWFTSLNNCNRARVLAALLVLRDKGPTLSRPYADTLKGSCYCNMKELRVQNRGDPLRVFFAFDPYRTGIMLCAGSKVGNEKRFYAEMIPLAEREYANWLNELKKKE